MLLGKLNKQHKSLCKGKDSVERIFMDIKVRLSSLIPEALYSAKESLFLSDRQTMTS